jgi:hypothetical protein
MKVTTCIWTLVLAAAGLALLACGDTSNSNARPANANAAVAPPANVAKTTAPPVNAEARVKEIDAYVSQVESKMSSMTRKETKVRPEDLKDVTEFAVSKIDTYSDNTTLKRLKAYPTAASQKTEEFYLENGKLVYVILEPQGGAQKNDLPDAKGEKLYFGDTGLIAWLGEDGKAKDTASPDFKKMGDKLQSELAAFRQLASGGAASGAVSQ